MRQRRHTTPQGEEESGLSQDNFEQVEYAHSGSDDDESDASSDGHVEPVEPVEESSTVHVKAPPKGEELRDIKDATDLFRSTSFKLQVSRSHRIHYSAVLNVLGQD